jgi:hypothetical protein
MEQPDPKLLEEAEISEMFDGGVAFGSVILVPLAAGFCR